jgi:GR25 family glycosyltransferase involved in LPS biosynthesis
MTSIRNISCPITYEVLCKPITALVENYDGGCVGFVKREFLARILAVAISAFQLLDFVYNAACLIGEGTLLLVDKIGIRCVCKETLATFSVATRALNLLKCSLGIVTGSVFSLLSPRMIVPFFFSPDVAFHKEELSIQYPLDTFFDHIYYISLDTAVEKRKGLEQHLHAIGCLTAKHFLAIRGIQDPEKRWEKMIGERGADSIQKNQQARLGCYQSHLELLKKVRAELEENSKPILILEDDAHLIQTKEMQTAFTKGMQDLASREWDIVYLGCETLCAPTRMSKHLDRVRSSSQTHAYAVNPKSINKLINALEESLQEEIIFPIDALLCRFVAQEKISAYALNPLVALQQEGMASEISGRTNLARESLLLQTIKRIYVYSIAPSLKDWLCISQHHLYEPATRCGLNPFETLPPPTPQTV